MLSKKKKNPLCLGVTTILDGLEQLTFKTCPHKSCFVADEVTERFLWPLPSSSTSPELMWGRTLSSAHSITDTRAERPSKSSCQSKHISLFGNILLLICAWMTWLNSRILVYYLSFYKKLMVHPFSILTNLVNFVLSVVIYSKGLNLPWRNKFWFLVLNN